jgi:AsmA protein
MKKLVKIIGFLAVVLVVTIIAVLVAAKFLITPDRVRQIVIPRAEARLSRPVSIGDINVRIFSGIVISDFVVGAKDETEDFVSAEELVLRYQFWPLLRLAVIVDEIRLESPEIRIERYKNGDFNFSDLQAEKETVKNKSQVDEPPDERQINLTINDISVSNGRLLFIDHMVDQEYELTDLSVSVSEFSPDQSFPFDISAMINSAAIELNGDINPQTMNVRAQAHIIDLDMAAFMPYAPEDFPGTISSLKLSADLTMEITEQQMNSFGKLTLNDIDMLLESPPDTHIENANAVFDYNFEMDMNSEKLTIHQADADINGIRFSASGHVLSYATEPVVDIRARFPKTLLSELIASLPQNLVEPVAEMRPSGHIAAHVHLKGSPDKPEELIEQGEMTLENISININQLSPKIAGDIRFNKAAASSDNLVIDLAGDRLLMNFTANNLMGSVININNNITADKLNIDNLLKSISTEEVEGKSPPVSPTDTPPSKPEELGPFDIPAQVKGDVRIANAVYQGLAVTNFDLQYQLKNNVLTISQIHGGFAGGKITGTARAELNRKPISYTAKISMEQTQAEKILNALFPAASNTVFGTMFLKSDIQGEGTTWNMISEKLTSRTDMNITNGRLTGTGIAGGLANFLNINRLEVIEFESVKGNVKLADGRFNIDSRFTGNDIRMAPKGTIGLDGSLKLSLDMRLAPDIASQIQIGRLYSQLATTDDGWTMVPLGVGGTLQTPRFSLDTSTISDQIRERGTEELRRRLQDKLVPPSQENNSPQTDKGKTPSPERILEDTLQRLFN